MLSDYCGAHYRALEQQIQDLNFQMSVVLNEHQRSSNGHFVAGKALPASDNLENGDRRIVTADDAISQHLLSFTDIQVHLLLASLTSTVQYCCSDSREDLYCT